MLENYSKNKTKNTMLENYAQASTLCQGKGISPTMIRTPPSCKPGLGRTDSPHCPHWRECRLKLAPIFVLVD
jgi:hypothetical protein